MKKTFKTFLINILLFSKRGKQHESQPQEQNWKCFILWMEKNDKWQNNVKWTLTSTESERLPVHTNFLPQGCMQTCYWLQTRTGRCYSQALWLKMYSKHQKLHESHCIKTMKLLCLHDLWLTSGEMLMKQCIMSSYQAYKCWLHHKE